jgi:hypothetical protein
VFSGLVCEASRKTGILVGDNSAATVRERFRGTPDPIREAVSTLNTYRGTPREHVISRAAVGWHALAEYRESMQSPE